MPRKVASARSRRTPGWRDFELLVTSVEKQMAPQGAVVKSPDRVRDIDTQRFREVDASIKFKVGSVDVLITIECRKRSSRADVTWIEQLATKRQKIGAAKTIAVSAAGFSEEAQNCANRYGIELRDLKQVTSNEIVELISSENFVHIYRLVDSIQCEAFLKPGGTENFHGMEPRFRHPHVNGLFPGVAFLSFIEMKDPQAFDNAVPLGGDSTSMTFELDGEGPNLVPIPLGEQRKSGSLDLLVNGNYMPVQRLILKISLRYVSEKVSTDLGQHYSYGRPDKPTIALSQYQGEVAGVPVRIDQYTTTGDGHSTATLRFPSGVELPGRFFNPLITDMSKVDMNVLHLKPVAIKVKGYEPIDGVFVHPNEQIIPDDLEREQFEKQNFLFIERGDLEKLKAGLIRAPNERFDWQGVLVIPKSEIEYIDLSAMMGVTSTHSGRAALRERR